MSKKIKINYSISNDMEIEINPTNYRLLLECLSPEDVKKFKDFTQSYLAKVDNLTNSNDKKIVSGKLEFKIEEMKDEKH